MKDNKEPLKGIQPTVKTFYPGACQVSLSTWGPAETKFSHLNVYMKKKSSRIKRQLQALSKGELITHYLELAPKNQGQVILNLQEERAAKANESVRGHLSPIGYIRAFNGRDVVPELGEQLAKASGIQLFRSRDFTDRYYLARFDRAQTRLRRAAIPGLRIHNDHFELKLSAKVNAAGKKKALEQGKGERIPRLYSGLIPTQATFILRPHRYATFEATVKNENNPLTPELTVRFTISTMLPMADSVAFYDIRIELAPNKPSWYRSAQRELLELILCNVVLDDCRDVDLSNTVIIV